MYVCGTTLSGQQQAAGLAFVLSRPSVPLPFLSVLQESGEIETSRAYPKKVRMVDAQFTFLHSKGETIG